jgi:hypothetical protein
MTRKTELRQAYPSGEEASQGLYSQKPRHAEEDYPDEEEDRNP